MANFTPNKQVLDTITNFAKNIEIQVGIVEPQIREDGLDMAYVQFTNQKNIPSRDVYIAPTIKKKDITNARVLKAMNFCKKAPKFYKKVKLVKFWGVLKKITLQTLGLKMQISQKSSLATALKLRLNNLVIIRKRA